MAQRFAYWTIILDGAPTAFRAKRPETLATTLKQLQSKNPDAAVRWFARGKLWASPAEAQQSLDERRQVAATGVSRDRDWRPGGDHLDPRLAWKRKQEARKQSLDDPKQWPDDAARDRPRESAPSPHRDKPWESRPKPHGQGFRGPAGHGGPPRPEWRDRPNRPEGHSGPPRPEWRGKDDRPRGDRPPAPKSGRRPAATRVARPAQSTRGAHRSAATRVAREG